MSLKIKIQQQNNEAWEKIKNNLPEGKHTLEVGWFENSKYDKATNIAYVASIQEYGYYKHDTAIPPRPFMRPAEKKNSQNWQDIVREGAKKCENISDTFKKLGMIVVNDIQKAIIDVHTPALQEATILNRMRRRAKGNATTINKETGEEIFDNEKRKKYLKYAKGKLKRDKIKGNYNGLAKPLIDTGKMFKEVSYRVDGNTSEKLGE
ncbi:MAG: hypothetical protein LBF97_04345 [Elusimicrobiota bacterium]|jgi:hypothetical protein|nr:hypothetical protein [Elusimicrobiota bacterium]